MYDQVKTLYNGSKPQMAETHKADKKDNSKINL
jgi:hypothetical protein